VKVIVYSDNIAIGADTPEAALCALLTLKQALGEGVSHLPGGLMLHKLELRDGYQRSEAVQKSDLPEISGMTLRPAVQFVGYQIRWDITDQAAHFSPSHSAWANYWRGVEELWSELPSSSTDWTLTKVAVKRYRKWRQSFPLWRNHRRAKELYFLNLQERLHVWRNKKSDSIIQ